MMRDYIEICGTPIEKKSIKDFRIIQTEYIYRPVFREVPPKNFLFKAGYEFEYMEPYAAIVDEDKPNPLMFWRKHEYKKYKCVNSSGREMSIAVEEIPILVHMASGQTSEIYNNNPKHLAIGRGVTPYIETVEALVIDAKEKHTFYGNSIHLFSVLDAYNKIKEALKTPKKKKEKEENKEVNSEADSGKEGFVSKFMNTITGVFSGGKSEDAEVSEGEVDAEDREIYDVPQDSAACVAQDEPLEISSAQVWDSHINRLPSGMIYKNKSGLSGIGIAIIAICGVLLLSLLARVGMTGIGTQTEDQTILVPNSARKLKGNQYEDVKAMFETSGFTNVQTRPKDDLITGWVHDDGEVSEVSINGDSSFADSAKFPPEATVIITYHTFPEKKKKEKKEEKEEKGTVDSTESESTSEVSEITVSSVDRSDIPEYAGKPFVELCGNQPVFTDEEKSKTDELEYYSALDSLGRCGVAYANISKATMPTEERGEIGHVKPSGWHLDKYNDLIDGNFLYNRCHLIAYSLAGENDNELNLITGTRYMNVDGMNPFELQVLDYIRSTDNHVLYRVTPIFEGDNLLASGVEMEAWSVEDNGKGICFHVYCYNVQPGIEIDYATGDNRLIEDTVAVSETEVVTIELTEYVTEDTTESTERSITETIEEEKQYEYILNTNSMKIHRPDCSSVADMAERNKQGFNGTIEEAKEMGYKPCKRCLKGY